MANQVKFVICERDFNNGSPIESVLYTYKNGMFTFLDGTENNFNPDLILKFDDYKSAQLIVDLAWDLNQTFLGVAIWESDYSEIIDYFYVTHGEEKNNQVKANRENQ